jgi:hypothetical protein
MHHQAIFDPAHLSKIKTVEAKVITHPDARRYMTKMEDDQILYDVYPNRIVVIRTVDDGDIQEYFPDEIYDWGTLSHLMVAVCYIHGKRVVQRGKSPHTVMVHERNATSRFIPMIESGYISMHERDGIVFTSSADGFHVAVPTEVVCSLYIEKMTHSLKIWDDVFKIRFKILGRFVYFPMSALYMDRSIRELTWRQYIPAITQYDWELARDKLEQLVEDFTAPKQ